MKEDTPTTPTDHAPASRAPTGGEPRKRQPFSIKRLVFWQFTVAPVFLMPLTVRQSGGSGGHPLARLATQVIVPIVYVAVLMWVRRRKVPTGVPTRNSMVIDGIRSGVGYSLLAALMSWGWTLYHPLHRLFDLVSSGLLLLAFRDLFLPTLVLPISIGLRYVVIGAATGCVVSLAIGRRFQVATATVPIE